MVSMEKIKTENEFMRMAFIQGAFFLICFTVLVTTVLFIKGLF